MADPNGKLSKDEMEPLVRILVTAEAVLDDLKNEDDREIREVAIKRLVSVMQPNQYQVEWHGILELKNGTDLILTGKNIDDHVYTAIKTHLDLARNILESNAQMKTWFQEALENITNKKN